MLKVEYVFIDSIRAYENNAKIHTEEQIEQIKKSIEEFGMNDPIGVWHEEIVEGHGRLIACKELGYNEVPIIRLDDLSDEQRKAYMLVHNQLTMNTGFDIDLLKNELEDITDIDMSNFGFESFDFDEEQETNDDISNKYIEEYQVIIVCDNEQEQEKVYDEMKERGYQCKVSTL